MRRLLLGRILIIALLAGCNASQSPATQTPMPTPTTDEREIIARQLHLDELARAENKWYGQRIANYRIAARFRKAMGAPSEVTVETTVTNGSKTNVTSSCPSCEWTQNGYDIPELFGAAREILGDPYCIASATYDDEFGFPRSVICTGRNVADNGRTISVLLFILLP